MNAESLGGGAPLVKPLTAGINRGDSVRLTIAVKYEAETETQIGFSSAALWPLGVIWIDRANVVAIEK